MILSNPVVGGGGSSGPMVMSCGVTPKVAAVNDPTKSLIRANACAAKLKAGEVS